MICELNEVKEMLIVGQVSSEEERCELIFVAQVFTIEERFRYLARSQRKK
jgi:hypothetical protein